MAYPSTGKVDRSEVNGGGATMAAGFGGAGKGGARGLLAALAAAWVMLLACGPGAGSARAQDQSFPEHQLKAGLIFQFVRYVEWPGETRGSERGPWVLGVLGNDEMFTALEAAVRGKKIRDRVLTVRRFSEFEPHAWRKETNVCDLLFIGKGYGGDVGKLLEVLAGLPVLTVADTPGFAERGGVFNLTIKTQRGGDRTIGFEINAQAAESAKLKVSPKLWHLGEKVKTRARD